MLLIIMFSVTHIFFYGRSTMIKFGDEEFGLTDVSSPLRFLSEIRSAIT